MLAARSGGVVDTIDEKCGDIVSVDGVDAVAPVADHSMAVPGAHRVKRAIRQVAEIGGRPDHGEDDARLAACQPNFINRAFLGAAEGAHTPGGLAFECGNQDDMANAGANRRMPEPDIRVAIDGPEIICHAHMPAGRGHAGNRHRGACECLAIRFEPGGIDERECRAAMRQPRPVGITRPVLQYRDDQDALGAQCGDNPVAQVTGGAGDAGFSRRHCGAGLRSLME